MSTLGEDGRPEVVLPLTNEARMRTHRDAQPMLLSGVLTVRAGEYDLGTATARMCARVVGAVARHESEHKGARISANHHQLALAGRRGGGPRRFGLTADCTNVVPAEAAAIRWAARRVLAGDSLKAIAERMPVPPLRAPAWCSTTITTLLTGPSVVGLASWHGDIVARATWPAILTRSTWERVRAELATGHRPVDSVLGGLLAYLAIPWTAASVSAAASILLM